MKSYYRKCKHCGQQIQLRQMPGGQWVAFEGYDQVHKCTSPRTTDYSLPKTTPALDSSKRGRLEQILEREQQLGYEDKAVAGGIEGYIDEWAGPYQGLHPDLSDRVNAVVDALSGYTYVSKQQRQCMIAKALDILRGRSVQVSNTRPVPVVKASLPAPSHSGAESRGSTNPRPFEKLNMLFYVVIGGILVWCLYIWIAASLSPMPVTPTPAWSLVNTTADHFPVSPQPQSPTAPPRVTQVLSAVKPSLQMPTPYQMWVCTDLAYGYDTISKQEHIVWQMSKRDSWSVNVLEQINAWYKVESNGQVAYMYSSDLCRTQPQPVYLPPTSIPYEPSRCPNGCTVPPLGCDIKGNISFDTREKIYHVPGGRFYDSTVINSTYGERWFCTEAEAQANGWRRSTQ